MSTALAAFRSHDLTTPCSTRVFAFWGCFARLRLLPPISMAFFGFGTALGDPIEGPEVLRVPAAVDEAVRRVPNLDRIEGQTLEDRMLSFEAKMREFSSLIDGLADVFPDPGDRRCLKREFAKGLMVQLVV